jgi:hypothetical protein
MILSASDLDRIERDGEVSESVVKALIHTAREALDAYEAWKDKALENAALINAQFIAGQRAAVETLAASSRRCNAVTDDGYAVDGPTLDTIARTAGFDSFADVVSKREKALRDYDPEDDEPSPCPLPVIAKGDARSLRSTYMANHAVMAILANCKDSDHLEIEFDGYGPAVKNVTITHYGLSTRWRP